MLIDIEYSNRKKQTSRVTNKECRIRSAENKYRGYQLHFQAQVKQGTESIHRLATCEYISEHQTFFITTATGCDKIYMACAFSIEAGKQYYNAKYIHLPDLLIDPEIAQTDSNYKRVIAKYANLLF